MSPSFPLVFIINPFPNYSLILQNALVALQTHWVLCRFHLPMVSCVTGFHYEWWFFPEHIVVVFRSPFLIHLKIPFVSSLCWLLVLDSVFSSLFIHSLLFTVYFLQLLPENEWVESKLAETLQVQRLPFSLTFHLMFWLLIEYWVRSNFPSGFTCLLSRLSFY